jgi:acyl-CoA synthetase (AMP-forming)/AMP-acid ligase II
MAITRDDTRLTADLIREFTGEGEWTGVTLTDLLERNARDKPDVEAFIDQHRRVTWKELWDGSSQLAAQLLRLGIGKGEIVAVQLPNRVEFVYALAAINRIGAVMCQYPPDYRSREVEFILGFTEAVAVIVPEQFRDFDYMGMVGELGQRLPALRHRLAAEVTGRALPGGWLGLRALASEAASPADLAEIDARRPVSDDVMRVAFTSGTTGQPKAVMHTYNTTFSTNRLCDPVWGIDGGTRFLQFLPIGLNAGLFTIVQACLEGAAVVLMEQFKPVQALELIEREQVTHFLTAPTGLIALLNQPALDKRDLTSLRLVQTGGSSTPAEVLRDANRRMGVPVIDVYGMLEAGWSAATDATEPYEEWVGTVGRPFPWQNVRIIDDEGSDVPAGEQGEIAKRSGSVCVGYYKNPQQNTDSFTADGWFRSGDLGRIDEHGRLSITGRKKDMIIHGGANIWPLELEEILFTHPKVLNASVIGVHDDYFGENVCVCIVPRPGQTVTLDEVIAYMAPRIAKYKLPQQLAVFDELPVGPTGKIQKQQLRQEIESLNG